MFQKILVNKKLIKKYRMSSDPGKLIYEKQTGGLNTLRVHNEYFNFKYRISIRLHEFDSWDALETAGYTCNV
jgi:hypothetical protein